MRHVARVDSDPCIVHSLLFLSVYPGNVAIHANFQFLLQLAIVNDFSPFGNNSQYVYTCVSLPSNGDLEWREGSPGVPITAMTPEGEEPYYVETVSSRELRLVLISKRVAALNTSRKLECLSSESGTIASMTLTTESNYVLLLQG